MTPENVLSIILSSISFSGVIVTALFVYLSSQKSGAAINQIAGAAATLFKPMDERLKKIEEELKERDKLIETLQEQVKTLGLELETERRKRRELEIRVDHLQMENERLAEERAGLISENGHLKAELAKHKRQDNRL